MEYKTVMQSFFSLNLNISITVILFFLVLYFIYYLYKYYLLFTCFFIFNFFTNIKNQINNFKKNPKGFSKQLILREIALFKNNPILYIKTKFILWLKLFIYQLFSSVLLGVIIACVLVFLKHKFGIIFPSIETIIYSLPKIENSSILDSFREYYKKLKNLFFFNFFVCIDGVTYIPYTSLLLLLLFYSFFILFCLFYFRSTLFIMRKFIYFFIIINFFVARAFARWVASTTVGAFVYRTIDKIMDAKEKQEQPNTLTPEQLQQARTIFDREEERKQIQIELHETAKREAAARHGIIANLPKEIILPPAPQPKEIVLPPAAQPKGRPVVDCGPLAGIQRTIIELDLAEKEKNKHLQPPALPNNKCTQITGSDTRTIKKKYLKKINKSNNDDGCVPTSIFSKKFRKPCVISNINDYLNKFEINKYFFNIVLFFICGLSFYYLDFFNIMEQFYILNT